MGQSNETALLSETLRTTPALALVAVVPFMPAADHDAGMYAEEEEQGNDTLNRFQHAFHLPVDLGLFAFGLVDAGVVMSSVGNGTWAVLVALMVGKTVGIFGMSMLAHALGFKLPDGLSVGEVALVGFIAGLGLTVALFVAGVAFTDPAQVAAAKMGALLSVLVAPIAIAVGRTMRAGELAAAEPVPAPRVTLTADRVSQSF